MAIASRPKPHAHHKKLAGKHHKPSKHYMKAYWPYLPVAAIVGIGIMVNAFLGSAGAVLGAASDLSNGSLLISTNEQRSSQGEPPLALNQQLTAAAQAKATDMVGRDYWSHSTPDGKQPWTFVTAAGYSYQQAGENLAYGFASAEDVIKGWMNSSEHRANILNASYQDVGFGVASSKNFHGTGPETIVVAMYGQPANGSVSNISFKVPKEKHHGKVLGASSQRVSQIQLLTAGAAPWSLAAAVLLTGIAASLFAIRHARFWHRTVARGELFVVTHPWFDISLVALAVITFTLSHTAGIIG